MTRHGEGRNDRDGAAPAADARVPVTVLTGFFGSGKSTLLARVLGAGGPVAVVNNDFAEASFSHALEEAVVADVTAGCVCCTRAGDLAGAILSALSTVPAQIVVETSGISDPAPVLRSLLGDPAIAPRLRLSAVVAAIDAVHGFAQIEAYPEARRQAALADRIILTKTDVAAAPEIATLLDALGRAAPGVPVIRSEAAGIGRALLAPAPVAARTAAAADAAHPASISSHLFPVETPVTRAALALFMDLMAAYRGGSVLRLKGVLDVEGEPTEIQGVLQAFHPPLALAHWPQHRRRPALAVVTDGLSRADLAPAFAALRFGGVPHGRLPSPETYARFRAIADRLRRPVAAAGP